MVQFKSLDDAGDRWYSRTEASPPSLVDVLVVGNNGRMEVRQFHSRYPDWFNITHWRKLPSPPEATND
jgi:hypothetical protein